jgi:hypothetical protein
LRRNGGAEHCKRRRKQKDYEYFCTLTSSEHIPGKSSEEIPDMKKLSTSTMRSAALAGVAVFTLALQSPAQQTHQDKLVEIVRNATQRYQNVANASPEYGPALGCVSGSDHGAMGVHYVNGKFDGTTLSSEGQLDATQPQALIYEPQANGEMKLVGVEFIVFASAVPANVNPQVEGHLMVYVGSPNRYGLPAFFELHVWAWKDNPQGAFVDWNDHVNCSHE